METTTRALLLELFDLQNDELAALRAADASLRKSHAVLTKLLDETEAPLSPEEQAKLNEMIAAGMADIAAGRVVDGDVAFARIDRRIEEAARKRAHA